MKAKEVITFVSHTNKPGGGELALRRYLEATTLRVRLVTMEAGGVWDGMAAEVVTVKGVRGLRLALRGGGLVVANSMRAAFFTALVLPRHGRLVYWVRDGMADSAMSSLALTLTKRVTARRVNYYIANSDWTAETVRQAIAPETASVAVVHSMCGVTENTSSHAPRVAPHEPVRLLYLGRISAWKAPDVAVRALALLQKQGIRATLTLVGGAHFGEKEYAETLRALVERTPGATWVGHVSDVQEIITNHDVLVHCSITPEPFGQVAVQAMSHGLPVAATDHGGIREVVRHRHNGILYRPADENALAAAVTEISSRYSLLSRHALETSRMLTDGRLLVATDSILEQLTGADGHDTVNKRKGTSRE